MTISSRRASGLRLERMQASKQYRGGAFVNTYPPMETVTNSVWSKASTLVEFMLPGQGRSPGRALPISDPREIWEKPADTGIRATWLGHSTVLLEIDGFRVLTDPVWAHRASPFNFAGPKRFQPAPVDIASLPPLDAVLISHDHYDHLDRASVSILAAKGARFVTSLGVGLHLEAWGVPAALITELDWWERAVLPGGLTITATPAHHFSGRGIGDSNATLWSSFALRGDRSAAFFSGDTGLSAAFGDIGRLLGPFDLVMMEVGAFHPSWGTVHLGPENACKAWAAIGSGRLLPIHWGTFDLATHAWYEPAEVLLARVPSEQLVMPRLGQPVEPAHITAVTPWWREVDGLHYRIRAGKSVAFSNLARCQ